MTAAWMLYVLVVGTLLAVAALAVDAAMRQARRPTRFVWAAALTGCVLLALVAPREHGVALVANAAAIDGVTPLAPTSVRAGLSMVERFTRLAGAASAPAAWLLARAASTVGTRALQSVSVPLAVLWGMASVMILAVLVGVYRRVDRARGAWPLATVQGTAVRIAPEAGPAVIGLARPEIVLPRWLLARSDDDQRLVVAHEREHLAARDQWLLTGGWLVAALLPWHPAVWWMLARLRLGMELDCDARVLRRDVPRQRYGSLLIDIAGQCAGFQLGAIALADRTTHLERRLLAMKTTRSRFTIARSAGLVALAAVLVVAACESKMPTQAEVASMDVASAERSAVKTKLITEGAVPVYTVNGVITPEATAKAIPAERIATIDVKKAMESGAPIIAITLRPAEAAGRGPQRSKLMVEEGRINAKEAFRGLVILDGVKSTMEAVGALKPESIESVNVIKGAAAKVESTDPAAEFGIIKITTKKGAP